MTQGILDLRCVSMYLADGKGDADAPIETAQFFSAGQMGSGLHPSVFKSSNESGSLSGRDLPKMIFKVKGAYIPKPCMQCLDRPWEEAARGEKRYISAKEASS
jgi:hypothetical protein